MNMSTLIWEWSVSRINCQRILILFNLSLRKGQQMLTEQSKDLAVTFRSFAHKLSYVTSNIHILEYVQCFLTNHLFLLLQERVDITKDVLSKGCTLESMRELVPLDRLAIVASLQLRARSILGQNYDPLLVESMSSIQVKMISCLEFQNKKS